jgi:UDP-N-acetylmuramoyl-L-alanyl-D-glutamate--2,6-diaminopimelate ligase
VGLSPELQNVEIAGLAANSADVRNSFVFFAIKGETADGCTFISRAIQNGASAIILEAPRKREILLKVPASAGMVIEVANPRLALAQIAANFYAKQPEHIVAITGTDGKTSTADFFRQLMFLCDKKSASMGTIGVIAGSGEVLRDGSLTTPAPIMLHKTLAELAENGVQYMALEASSHGLAQYRLDGVNLQAAAFTNIARDHLDFHKTEADYFSAKARLFRDVLPKGETAVISADSSRYFALRNICEVRGQQVIGFGENLCEFHVRAITPHTGGQSVLLTLFDKKYNVEVPLVGAFQVMNILAALGLAVGVGCDLEEVLQHIPQLKGVAGRLELVASLNNGAKIYIDYAHTPLALSNILTTLRPHTEGRLVVVFGCGGDRDAGKRPLMGDVAARLANVAIVTDDNPRSENPAAIRAEVLAGTPTCKEIADRKEAIYFAVKQLEKGDVLVIAGKGHEKTQIIGSEHLPFDDAKVAQEVVHELGLLV